MLINNAGYNQIGLLEELTMEEIRRQFETNVFGFLRMCQLVLPGMRSQGATGLTAAQKTTLKTLGAVEH